MNISVVHSFSRDETVSHQTKGSVQLGSDLHTTQQPSAYSHAQRPTTAETQHGEPGRDCGHCGRERTLRTRQELQLPGLVFLFIAVFYESQVVAHTIG